jgi:diguanylate cyclase (GGDEF)-like protein/PAS domain S-box-containing protein
VGQLGHGSVGGAGRADAVARADLRRAQRSVVGGPHPAAARFASAVAAAVGAEGDDAATDPRALPALRDAVFGSRAPDVVPLPAAPALVCDRADRIVRANPALLRLAGRADGEGDLLGMRLPQLVVGPEADARLVRPDGRPVRVRVVRWPLPGDELSAAVLVELDAASAGGVPDAASAGGAPGARGPELERLARVGTWRYDLATAVLERSGTLVDLYRAVGVDPDGGGAHPVEGEQVARLCRGLRAGERSARHDVELRLPDDRVLTCRAEVERGPDGAPTGLLGVVRDATPERLPRPALAGQRFADLMALVPGGVALVDPDGRVADANPGLAALLGAAPAELRGTPVGVLAGLPEGKRPDWLRSGGPGGPHRVGEVALLRADGTTAWCDLAVSATGSDDGGRGWLVVATDVGERRRAAELLRSAGSVDELTRLPNRTACLELVDRLLAGRDRDRVAVVCGDLDDFQRVNSSLGHEAGDELLVGLAGRLQRELPVSCTAARLSGDEFVVICADHAEVGGPDQLARTVVELLRTTVTVHGRPVQLTASVGLATPVPTGDVRAADLLRFAEAALHDAKRRQGRAAIGVATHGVVSTATRALELEAELRAAIAGDGLVLDYQPVVGPDGTITSAEALVRWPHPERGLIPPGDFLPVAQRSGLLRDLDLWVLRTAATEATGWPAHRGAAPSVAVNLAGLLPGEPDFLDAVSAAVTGSGLAWDRLVLELVETSLVELPPDALAAMEELHERGVRFAVDDFGTGYSSLARLRSLPAQTVKVDRAFVTGVADDPADFAVARAVVDMARAMGRTTVAEGVETAEQFHVLRGIGVHAYQGWLFSRAVGAGELRVLLERGRLATPAAADAGLRTITSSDFVGDRG